MSIYIIILVLFTLALFLEFSQKINKKLVVFFLFFILLVLSIYRDSTVGTDVSNYEYIYYKLFEIPLLEVIKNSDGSYIYDIYSKLLSYLFKSPHAITMVNSSIILSIMYFLIIKLSRFPILSTYLYYTLYIFFYNWNAARQSLAICVSLLAFYFFYNNKKSISYSLIIISILIHNTAVVTIIYPLIFSINWNRRRIIYLMCLSPLIISFYNLILEVFINIFPRYNMYFSSGTYSFSDVGEGKKIILSFYYLFLIIIYLFFINKDNKKLYNRQVLSIVAILTIGTILGVFFYNNLLMARIETYFTIYSIFFIISISC